MPEIWLRYGSTDVVLDIKFENLASQISAPSSLQPMPDDQVNAAIEGGVRITDNMLVVVLSPSKAAARVVSAIAGMARAKGFAITVDVPARLAGALRSSMTAALTAAPAPDSRQQQQATEPQAESTAISINRIDYQYSLEERAARFQSAVIVSQVSYDPLFGFAGAPTHLARALYPESMAQAFASRKGNMPAPGIEGEPLKIAREAVAGRLHATSVELVAAGGSGGSNSGSIAGVHAGTVDGAFASALAQFGPASTVQYGGEPVRSAIISAGSEPATHSTLAGALNSLWNSVHAVKEGGTAVLLAEAREGLGGGALQAFVEGRLRPEQLAALQPLQYTEGLEHLLYLQELRQKRELGLVSSLPHYYSSRLGFATYSGVKDAHDKMLAKHGRGHKELVISDADAVLVRTAA